MLIAASAEVHGGCGSQGWWQRWVRLTQLLQGVLFATSLRGIAAKETSKWVPYCRQFEEEFEIGNVYSKRKSSSKTSIIGFVKPQEPRRWFWVKTRRDSRLWPTKPWFWFVNVRLHRTWWVSRWWRTIWRISSGKPNCLNAACIQIICICMYDITFLK